MLEKYIYKNNQKMRLGYTTGSCAAGAAKAALQMLLTGKPVPYVELTTPKGIRLNLEVLDINIQYSENTVSCAVKKDAGDDPDVTDGLKIYASVCKTGKAGIRIDGGEGVGRVTREGLEQSVGSAAINSVPRAMIQEGVEEVCRCFGYGGGISVIISIPEGRELAKKTFNPRLGIEGGLSVLGTSGIVEPMSEAALIETIRMEIRMQNTQGHKYLVLAPGNYGLDFLKEYNPKLLEHCVKYSNFLGEALDAAAEYGFQGVLIAGHIGKLVKLAGGIMNTHSRNADARMEILTSHAAVLGAGQDTAAALMDCVTTDEALDILKDAGLLKGVMNRLMERMEFYVSHRSGGAFSCGVITFSLKHGILGKSEHAEEILRLL